MYFLIEMWYNENNFYNFSLDRLIILSERTGDVRVGAEAFFVWF